MVCVTELHPKSTLIFSVLTFRFSGKTEIIFRFGYKTELFSVRFSVAIFLIIRFRLTELKFGLVRFLPNAHPYL